MIRFANGSSAKRVETQPMPEFVDVASIIVTPDARVDASTTQINAVRAQELANTVRALRTNFKPGPERDRQIELLRRQRAQLARNAPPTALVRGLPNIGNTCYINAVLQIMAGLRVLQRPLPMKDITAWQDLQDDTTIPEYLRIVCEQLASMRTPSQTREELKSQHRRLRKLARILSTSIFHEDTGRPQDAIQLLQTIMQGLVDARPFMGCIYMFGMCSMNSDTKEKTIHEENMLSIHVEQMRQLQKNKLAVDKGTDLEFALRACFPEKRRLSLTGDSYLFPLIEGHPLRQEFSSRYAFGTTWLFGIFLNWFRGYNKNTGEAIMTSKFNFSFPIVIQPSTSIGVAFEDDVGQIVEDSLAVGQESVLRAVLLHDGGHYYSYIRKGHEWWRMDDDAEPRNITREVDFPKGKLANTDTSARPIALFYENKTSHATDK